MLTNLYKCHDINSSCVFNVTRPSQFIMLVKATRYNLQYK